LLSGSRTDGTLRFGKTGSAYQKRKHQEQYQAPLFHAQRFLQSYADFPRYPACKKKFNTPSHNKRIDIPRSSHQKKPIVQYHGFPGFLEERS
jgi:hypothetical protein